MKTIALATLVCLLVPNSAWAYCLTEGQAVRTPEGAIGVVTEAFCDIMYERYTVELEDRTTVVFEAEITDGNRLPVPAENQG